MKIGLNTLILLTGAFFVPLLYHLYAKVNISGSCFNFLNMVAGKPYNLSLFAVDWVLILLFWGILFSICNRLNNSFENKNDAALSSEEGSKLGFELGFKSGSESGSESGSKSGSILGTLDGFIPVTFPNEKSVDSKPFTDLSLQTVLNANERNHFQKEILSKSGPAFKNQSNYLESLYQGISPEHLDKHHLNQQPDEMVSQLDNDKMTVKDDNAESKNDSADSWITLDLGELADWEEKGLTQMNALAWKTEDLLAEQEIAIYGKERPLENGDIDTKSKRVIDELSLDSDAEHSVMKVIYRKK